MDKHTGEELDMGGGFDFFGEISHHGTDLITEEQERNRNILREAMVAAGFKPYRRSGGIIPWKMNPTRIRISISR